MNLFQIDGEIEKLFQTADSETGEISEDTASKLEQLTMSISEKIRNICLLIKSLAYENKCLDEEAHKLSDRIVKNKKKIEWLKNYLSAYLKGSPVKGVDFEVKFSKSSTTEVDSDFIEWALKNRPDLIEQKPAPEPTPKKTAIANAIKAGDELEHCWKEEHSNIKVL